MKIFINNHKKTKNMKTTIAIVVALFLFACNTKEDNYNWSQTAPVQTQSPVIETPKQYKTITYYKVIKDLKEIQEQSTTNKTKVNWAQSIWHGDLHTQIVPNVHTTTRYFIIYTDKSKDQVDENTFITSSIGDSVAFTYQQEIQ